MLQHWSKKVAHYGQNILQELIFITSYMNFFLVQKICFPESFSGRHGVVRMFCHFDNIVEINILIKIDILVKIDIFVKLIFSSNWYFRQNWYFYQNWYFRQNWQFCQNRIFDNFINCFWWLHQLSTVISTFDIFINYLIKISNVCSSKL